MLGKRGLSGYFSSVSCKGRVKFWVIAIAMLTLLLAPEALAAGCIGTTLTNSHLCTDDDKGFTGTRSRTLVSACTSAVKCEYICDTFYKKSGNSCVLNTCTGTVPASPAILCSGDDSQLTADASRTLEYACTEGKKCEYICSVGSVKEGTSCVTPSSCTSPNEYMVAWWRGNNNFNDALGNTLQADGGGVDFTGGKVASAFRFDSSGSDLIIVPDTSVLDITGALTLELWINPAAAADKQIIRKMVLNPIRGYGLVMTSDQKVKFWINEVTITSDYIVPLNNWAHLAAVYSPGTYMKIFINGIPHGLKTTGVPASITANTADLKIGGGIPGQYFSGKLDEISIYNRELSIAEIQHVVAASQHGKCLFAESACTDGLDNDEDGKTDCADSNCLGFAGDASGHLCEAVEANCADGFDNDGDGSADVADATNCNKGKACIKSDGQAGAIVWSYYLPAQQSQRAAGTPPQVTQRGCCTAGSGQCVVEGTGCINKYSLTADPQWICGDNNNLIQCGSTAAASGTKLGSSTCQGNQWTVLEDCTNGVDDDGDGATDCLDTQCNADPSCPQECSVAPANLQGWWRGENNAQDEAGSNGGTLVGVSSGQGYAAGKVGTAFNLDGSDDQVRVPSSTSLSITGPITIEGWIFPTVSGDKQIVRKHDGSKGYALAVTNTNKLIFWVNDKNLASSGSAGTVTLNAWNYLAAAYDQSSMKVYINGNLAGEKATDVPSSILANVQDFRIGGGVPGQLFQGKVDELSIYSRALTQPEILTIAGRGSFGKCLLREDCGTPADDDQDGKVNCADADCAGNANCQKTQCTVPPDGIVSWWTGDGNELDSAGSNHAQRGTVSGADDADPTFTAGQVGQAFSFDGNDFLQVANEGAFDFALEDRFSLATWFKTSATTGLRPLLNKKGASGPGYHLILNKGKLRFLMAGSGSGETIMKDTAGTYADGAWHQVAVTYDGSGNGISGVVMYIDGMAVGTSTLTNNIPADGNIQNDEPLLIGKGAGSFFNGIIDEPTVYNRVLSSGEVQLLYDKGKVAQHQCLEDCDNGITDDEDVAVDGKDSECEGQPCDADGNVGVATTLTALDSTTSISYGCCGGGPEGECMSSTGGRCVPFDTPLPEELVCAGNNDFKLCFTSTAGELSDDRHYYCFDSLWRGCTPDNLIVVGKKSELECTNEKRWIPRTTPLDSDGDGMDDGDENTIECVKQPIAGGYPSGAAFFPKGHPFAGCLKGDINDDNTVDGADITPFIIQYRILVNQPGNDLSRADLNEDNAVDGGDITPFIIQYRVNN